MVSDTSSRSGHPEDNLALRRREAVRGFLLRSLPS
jgi:hypothetical protein